MRLWISSVTSTVLQTFFFRKVEGMINLIITLARFLHLDRICLHVRGAHEHGDRFPFSHDETEYRKYFDHGHNLY